MKLVRAGFREKTVVSIINSRLASFDLTPDGLVRLKKDGVPERVIITLLSRGGTVFEGDDWNDDLFLKAWDVRRGVAAAARRKGTTPKS